MLFIYRVPIDPRKTRENGIVKLKVKVPLFYQVGPILFKTVFQWSSELKHTSYTYNIHNYEVRKNA